MEQGNSKHGPAHDESLKHETQGLMRAGRSTHADEWRDPEPPGEDIGAPLTGGVPSGMTQRDVAERSALASHLGQAIFPAGIGEVLAKLREHRAPDQLVERVAELPPDRTYQNVQELSVALGLAVEKGRF